MKTHNLIINKRNLRERVKIVRWIMLSIVATLFVFEGIVLAVLFPILKNQAIKAAETAFLEAEIETKMLIERAKETAIKVLMDPDVSLLLNATNTEMLAGTDLYQGLKQLRFYKATSDDIESIYVFNRKINQLYTTNGRRIYSDMALYPNQDYLEWCIDKENIHKMKVHTIPAETTEGLITYSNVYSYVISNRSAGDALESAVIVNMSLDESITRYSQYYTQNKVYIGIRDSKDIINELNFLDIENEKLYREWWGELIEQDVYSDVKSYDGVKYSLISMKSKEVGLGFIMISPWEDIYGAITNITKIIFYITICVMILGLIISLLASRGIQKIYSEISNDRQKFLQMLQNSLEFRQMKFWQRYLTGIERYSSKKLKEQVMELGFDEKMFEGNLALFSVDLSGKTEYKEKVQNIVKAYLDTYTMLSPKLLFYSKDHFIFLHCTKERDVFEQLRNGVPELEKKISYDFNILGNNEKYQIEEFPLVWEEIQSSEKLQFFYPYRSCLEYKQIANEHQDITNCSKRKLIMEFSEAAVSGNEESISKLFSEFCEKLNNKTLESYKNHLIWLCMSVTNELAHVERDFQHSGKVRYEDILRDVYQCRKRSLLEKQVESYLKQFICKENQQKRDKASDKIYKVQQYVKENYSNKQLTIELIAEEHNLSADYLRKIYKMTVGESLSDYIMQERLRIAKEKLENSSETSRDIADSCGFSNANYFYTCFKKSYGMSPTTYRSMLQNIKEKDEK